MFLKLTVMRVLFFLLISFPFYLKAQINRSANELAREKVADYIVTKLFKDLTYQPVSYGELKESKQPQSDINWVIRHNFEIIDSQFVADRKIAVRKPYSFSFYLDKKLKVLTAESFYRD
jgi:hypothetical protein